MWDSCGYQTLFHTRASVFLRVSIISQASFCEVWWKTCIFCSLSFYHLQAGRLWASSQAGASHPFHVTPGSGVVSVSRRGTKCLARVHKASCGANCPSQIHQSIFALRGTWDYMFDQFCARWTQASFSHSSVCVLMKEICAQRKLCVFVARNECAVLVRCPADVLFFLVLLEVRGAVTCAAWVAGR